MICSQAVILMWDEKGAFWDQDNCWFVIIVIKTLVNEAIEIIHVLKGYNEKPQKSFRKRIWRLLEIFLDDLLCWARESKLE